MHPLTPEKLFMAIDRISSELLWSLAQLNEQSSDPQLRQRIAEMLAVVIAGLRHQHQQFTNTQNRKNYDSKY
jgi:hypothetical protein